MKGIIMAEDRMCTWMSSRHVRAVIAAVVYMIAGILLAVVFARNEIELGVAFTIIMLGPVLLYLIASGSISEFTAPGGFGASCQNCRNN
jgi:hypothetical protein